MVQLCIKGTKFPDEAVFEAQCGDSVATVTSQVVHLHNMRHKVRLQLYSMGELSTTLSSNAAAAGATEQLKELAARYASAYQRILAAHKDAKRVCAALEFDELWRSIKQLTIEAFPTECIHKDGDDAAINRLYELHENPDLDEDYRLHVYHCRAIMDPQWRENEIVDESKGALWFCGKVLDVTKKLGDYCNNNAKSKLTVKVALKDGPAPAGEPRMSYDDQRVMRNYVCTKRETLKQLEDSELRDRVVQLSRGKVQLGLAGGDALNLKVSGVKKSSDQRKDENDEDEAA